MVQDRDVVTTDFYSVVLPNYIPSYFQFAGRSFVHDFSHGSALTLGELLTFIDTQPIK